MAKLTEEGPGNPVEEADSPFKLIKKLLLRIKQNRCIIVGGLLLTWGLSVFDILERVWAFRYYNEHINTALPQISASAASGSSDIKSEPSIFVDGPDDGKACYKTPIHVRVINPDKLPQGAKIFVVIHPEDGEKVYHLKEVGEPLLNGEET
jgi:hypothetical protein